MFFLLLTTLLFLLGETTLCTTGSFFIHNNSQDAKSRQNPSLDSFCTTARDEVCVQSIVHDRNATAPPYLKFVAGCALPPKATANCTHCHRESIIDGREHNETEAQLYEFSCCCDDKDRCSTPALSAALRRDLSIFFVLSSTPPLAIPSKMSIGTRIALFVVYTAIALGIQIVAIFFARRVKRKKAVAEAAKKGKTDRSLCDTAK